jgi:carboxyl-terminal processing protease
MRAGSAETKIIRITRAKIELKDSEARSVIFEEQMGEGAPTYKIGVIDLPSFYMDMAAASNGERSFKSTTRDVRRILEDFSEKGVDAVILDLRRNGGGSLTEAINLTGLFIDRGPVVQVKDSEGRIQHYDDLDRGMAWDGPLVVLTSKLSASASEILAGAVQDYQRGIVVGDDATHGKGTVQSLLNLGKQLFRGIPNPPNLGALKITMQQFYRPKGDSTQKRGVVSDIELPSMTTHMDIGEEDLDYAIEFDRVPACEYDHYNLVNAATLAELRNRTSARQQESEDFGKLQQKIDRYKEYKDRKSVSLCEEEFLAQLEELNPEEEEKKTFEEDEDKDEDEIVVRDFYFNEVLAITLDYLDLLKGNRIAQVVR